MEIKSRHTKESIKKYQDTYELQEKCLKRLVSYIDDTIDSMLKNNEKVNILSTEYLNKGCPQPLINYKFKEAYNMKEIEDDKIASEIRNKAIKVYDGILNITEINIDVGYSVPGFRIEFFK